MTHTKWFLIAGLVLSTLCTGGCRKQPTAQDSNSPAEVNAPCITPAPVDTADANLPCITPTETAKVDYSDTDIPRFASNSPFDVNYTPPIAKEGKILWAKSFLWDQPPELIVEKWLTDKPDTRGKCVLLEFWATWCPPCRKSINLLNQLHDKYKDRLVVIGISEESEEAVRKLKTPKTNYFVGIDTQMRTKKAMAVRGIPHIVILEPDGYVVWEGFPYQKGYELTEEIVGAILDTAATEE